jgi:hypothetical protein
VGPAESALSRHGASPASTTSPTKPDTRTNLCVEALFFNKAFLVPTDLLSVGHRHLPFTFQPKMAETEPKPSSSSSSSSSTSAAAAASFASSSASFGQRHLREDAVVFAHNAWDNVAATPAQEVEAKAAIAHQKQHPVPTHVRQRYTDPQRAAQHWDTFYGRHENRFFKDRRWLWRDFPELLSEESRRRRREEEEEERKEKREGATLSLSHVAQDEEEATAEIHEEEEDGDPTGHNGEDAIERRSGEEEEKEREKGKPEMLFFAPRTATFHSLEKAHERHFERLAALRRRCGVSEEAVAVKELKPPPSLWERGQHATRRVLEVGCGAGNTVFPLLNEDRCV